MKYAGQVAIVTGAASGIGRALAEALARRGVRVVLADIDIRSAEQVARELAESGARATAVAVDVADEHQVTALVEGTLQREGRLDYMFNNAGIGAWGDARDLSAAQWQRVIDINLWGAIYGSLAAYRHMAEQGNGHIVNMASLAGLVPAPVVVPYATAKHGVVGLSQSLRAEAASLGVAVSVVCPGPIVTRFHASLETPAETGRRPRPPAESMDVGYAAEVILAGVENNDALILFPPKAKRIWYIWRFLPWLVRRINAATVRRLRKARKG